MKTTLKIFIAILVLVSVNTNAQFKKIKGNGDETTKTRTVGSFNNLSVAGSFDVELLKGNEGEITITTDSNLIDYIETTVKDNVLKIKFKQGYTYRSFKSIKLKVAFNSIESIKISGSGEVVSNDVINGNSLELNLSGSGNMNLNVNTTNLTSNTSGSGNIKLQGVTNSYNCSVSGSGNNNAGDLKTQITSAKVSGSGNITVYVEKEINAKTSGSGNIIYYGNPTIVKANSSGSGSVHKKG